MDKFFIAIYRFFEKKKALMYGLLILSSVIFVYFVRQEVVQTIVQHSV